MRAQMVLTYIISKGVINNKTIEDIVCPALILAANSTDDLHVQNNIVTVNNCESFFCLYLYKFKVIFKEKYHFDNVIVAYWKTWVVRCGIFKIVSLSCLSCCIDFKQQQICLPLESVDLLPSKRAVVECSFSLTITASFDEHRIDIGQLFSNLLNAQHRPSKWMWSVFFYCSYHSHFDEPMYVV